MYLMGIVRGSQFEADVTMLQAMTGASSLEAAIEQAVAREANLLRQLNAHRSVKIQGSNPDGCDVEYA